MYFWIDLAAVIFTYLHNGVSGPNAAQHVGKEHRRGSAPTIQNNILITTQFAVKFQIAQ